jgi:hypothetical protein
MAAHDESRTRPKISPDVGELVMMRAVLSFAGFMDEADI